MNESDKNIENLIDKMMCEETLHSPSMYFTSNIMSQILVAEKSQAKIYKPLISKAVWLFIMASLIALAIYASLFSETKYTLEISKI
jgi:ABC-type uncharacterized transport system permease subunit